MTYEFKDLIKKLQGVGLSEKEAYVYVTLNKFYKTRLGTLAVEMSLGEDEVDKVLEGLKDKGLVSISSWLGKKTFYPRDLRHFKHGQVKGLILKKNYVKLLYEELKVIRSAENSILNHYKGMHKIRKLFIREIRNQEEGGEEFSIETYAYGFSFSKSLMGDRYDEYENERINKKFKTNALIVVKNHWDKQEEIGNVDNHRMYNETKVIQLPSYGFSCSYVWKDKVWILVRTQENFNLIEIKNRDVWMTYRFNFDLLWKQAEPIYKSEE